MRYEANHIDIDATIKAFFATSKLQFLIQANKKMATAIAIT